MAVGSHEEKQENWYMHNWTGRDWHRHTVHGDCMHSYLKEMLDFHEFGVGWGSSGCSMAIRMTECVTDTTASIYTVIRDWRVFDTFRDAL